MPATVLIVDDEPRVLRLLSRIFEGDGYTVLPAESGDTAVQLFDQHAAEIEALVLDVIIPPFGAGTVLEHVYGKRPDLNVVLVSGDLLHDDLRALLESKGGTFLLKPFLPKELLRTVECMRTR
jgi:two-component system cell cycle sensor histidine kinase/response regulator CckA